MSEGSEAGGTSGTSAPVKAAQLHLRATFDSFYPLQLDYPQFYTKAPSPVTPLLSPQSTPAETDALYHKMMTGRFYLRYCDDAECQTVVAVELGTVLTPLPAGVIDHGDGSYTIQAVAKMLGIPLPQYPEFTLVFSKLPKAAIYIDLFFDSGAGAPCDPAVAGTCPNTFDVRPLAYGATSTGGKYDTSLGALAVYNPRPHSALYVNITQAGTTEIFPIFSTANPAAAQKGAFRFSHIVGLFECSDALACLPDAGVMVAEASATPAAVDQAAVDGGVTVGSPAGSGGASRAPAGTPTTPSSDGTSTTPMRTPSAPTDTAGTSPTPARTPSEPTATATKESGTDTKTTGAAGRTPTEGNGHAAAKGTGDGGVVAGTGHAGTGGGGSKGATGNAKRPPRVITKKDIETMVKVIALRDLPPSIFRAEWSAVKGLAPVAATGNDQGKSPIPPATGGHHLGGGTMGPVTADTAHQPGSPTVQAPKPAIHGPVATSSDGKTTPKDNGEKTGAGEEESDKPMILITGGLIGSMKSKAVDWNQVKEVLKQMKEEKEKAEAAAKAALETVLANVKKLKEDKTVTTAVAEAKGAADYVAKNWVTYLEKKIAECKDPKTAKWCDLVGIQALVDKTKSYAGTAEQKMNDALAKFNAVKAQVDEAVAQAKATVATALATVEGAVDEATAKVNEVMAEIQGVVNEIQNEVQGLKNQLENVINQTVAQIKAVQQTVENAIASATEAAKALAEKAKAAYEEWKKKAEGVWEQAKDAANGVKDAFKGITDAFDSLSDLW
ncbi:MAG: hypothetical protein HY543_05535 [Deltaproteobacteria bacterium]|nr:hypothetical protein [Deltaproteobacteria bacterium]